MKFQLFHERTLYPIADLNSKTIDMAAKSKIEDEDHQLASDPLGFNSETRITADTQEQITDHYISGLSNPILDFQVQRPSHAVKASEIRFSVTPVTPVRENSRPQEDSNTRDSQNNHISRVRSSSGLTTTDTRQRRRRTISTQTLRPSDGTQYQLSPLLAGGIVIPNVKHHILRN